MTPGNNSIEIKKNVDVVPTRTDAQSELKEAASLHNLKKEVVVAPEKQNILFTNADVVNSTVTEKDVDAFEKNITQDSQNKGEDKSFLSTATETIGRSIHEHPILRSTGALTSCILLYKRSKRRREKREKREAKAKKDGTYVEKKSFRQTGWGKALKRGLIGGGAYYGVHGLATGRWAMDQLFNWERMTQDEKQTNSYEKLSPVEKEPYEKFGGATDAVYESIFGKELTSGRQDEADMETISQRASGGKKSLLGVVPYTLDKKYSNVSSMLSESGQFSQMIHESAAVIKDKVVGLIAGAAGAPIAGFLSLFGYGKTAGETFDQRWNKNPEAHAKEMKFFFRETVRVQTFLLEKRKFLEKKIAAEKAGLTAGAKVEDLIDNKEWMEKNVYNDPRYIGYMTGNIKNAYDILAKEGLLNGDIDQETANAVADLDAKRDSIVGTEETGGDKLVNAEKDIADGSLDQKSKQEMYKMSQDIVEYMDDDFLDAMQESAWSVWSNFFNTDEAAKRMFMEKADFKGYLGTIKKGFSDIGQLLASGTITKEQFVEYKNLVNTFFAFSKEIVVGSHTFQVVKSNADWGARLGHLYKGMAGNLLTGMQKFGGGVLKLPDMLDGDFSGVKDIREGSKYFWIGAPALAATGGVMYLGGSAIGKEGIAKTGNILFRTGVKTIVAPGTFLTSRPAMRLYGLMSGEKVLYSGKASLLRVRYFGSPKGPSTLLKEFHSGKISLHDMARIAEDGKLHAGFTANDPLRAEWERVFGGPSDVKTNVLYNKWKMQLGLDLSDMKVVAPKYEILKKYYDVGGASAKLRTNFSATFMEMQKIETARAGLTTMQGELFDKVLAQRGVRFDRLQDVLKHVASIDDALLQGVKDINMLAKNIAKAPSSVLSNKASLEAFIKEIDAGKTIKEATITANAAITTTPTQTTPAPTAPTQNTSAVTRSPAEQKRVEGIKKKFEQRLSNIDSHLSSKNITLNVEEKALLQQDKKALRNLITSLDTFDTKTISLLEDIMKVQNGGRAITCIASLSKEGVQVEKMFVDIQKMTKTGATLEESVKFALQANMDQKLLSKLTKAGTFDKYVVGIVDAAKADAKILSSLAKLAKEGAALEKIFKGIAKIKI